MKLTHLLSLFFYLIYQGNCYADIIKLSDLPCVATKIVSNGNLCALRASSLDPEAKDENPEAILGKHFGFGLHVLGLPQDLKTKNTLHLHFGGSFGKPYDEEKSDFRSATFLNELMARGQIVIQLAYSNGQMVNGPRTCRKKYADVDNCAGLVRQGKLYGGGPEFQRTNGADSILSRWKKLEELLIKKKVLPTPLNWEQISLSGHSQGAGMALFMAMKFKVKKVCLLAGGYDGPDRHSPKGEVADWLDPKYLKTPLKSIFGLIHIEDRFYEKLKVGYEVLGLQKGKNWIEITGKDLHNYKGEVIKNGHGAVIAAKELGDIWRQLCL